MGEKTRAHSFHIRSADDEDDMERWKRGGRRGNYLPDGDKELSFHCAKTQKQTSKGWPGEKHLCFLLILGIKPVRLHGCRGWIHTPVVTPGETRAVGADQRKKKAQTRCQSVIQFHNIRGVYLFDLFILFFFPIIVNSIKSNPPHSLCGLLRSRGGEAVETGMWEKDYKE